MLDRLRIECPWDRQQTWKSLRTQSIEEVYELSDALMKEDVQNVKKELGDVLLHVAFYAKIASEQGFFDIADVLESLTNKLIYRHPHVFGEAKAESAAEVTSNWEQLKLKEKGGNKTVLSGVPDALPALIKAYRIQGKAKGVGFDWNAADEVWDKVNEELGEFRAEVEAGNTDGMEDEFGDILFAIINLARHYKINPENALERTNQKFIRRFNYLESKTIAQGRSLKDMTLEEMDAIWDEAKRIEKQTMRFIGKAIVKGTQVVPTSEQLPIGLDGEIYEVMRVEQRTPLFIADHMQRFRNTLGAERWERLNATVQIPQLIRLVIENNDFDNCDIRLCIAPNGELQIGYVATDYPTAEMYENGVACELLSAIRENPEAKIYHAPMRSAASEQQKEHNAYESILVNNEGQITEGSRSNVFFVKDGALFTAPDEAVLHGVMRKKVLEITNKLKISVNFVSIDSVEVNKYEAAFLSSTPMRILPIKSIGKVQMNPQSAVVRKLMLAMQTEIEHQITS